MEKVFKILAVFALLMLVILYSVKAKERKFREYFFLRRINNPSMGQPDWALLAATIITGEEGGQRADDREGQLSFHAGRVVQTEERGEGEATGDGTAAGDREVTGDKAVIGDKAAGEGMTLIVTDQATGLTIATISLTEPIDGLLFAPETKLIYCCSGEGILTILRQNNRSDYSILQRLTIPKGGSQMALDIRNGNLYIYAGESVLVYAHV
jgi:hypothetical protein